MGVNLSSLPSQYSDQDAKEASLALAADYTGVALLSVAVWDTLLCLRSEFLLIWRARSTALKWFYLLTRYLGLATGALLVATNTSRVLSESKTCKHLARAVLSLATLASTFGLLIRSYRVLAIYSFNRSILILLSFFVLLATVLQFYIVSKWQGAEVPDGIMGCYPTPNPDHLWEVALYWVPLVLVSALLLALVLYKGVSRYRDAAEHKATRIPLYMVFWRDGARFQLLILAIYLTALILFVVNEPLLGPLFLSIASVGTTTIVCRLVHSLRSQLLTTSIPESTQPSSGAEQRTTTSYICGEFGTLDESNLPGHRNIPPLASVEVVQGIEESISEAQDPPSPVSTRNSSV